VSKVGEGYDAHIIGLDQKLQLNPAGKGKTHAANDPDHPVGAFPFGCVAQLAIQRALGILSEWRIRLNLDHCRHLNHFRYCINI
jgi:hypothetical protein